jgi:hypothetical protein
MTTGPKRQLLRIALLHGVPLEASAYTFRFCVACRGRVLLEESVSALRFEWLEGDELDMMLCPVCPACAVKPQEELQPLAASFFDHCDREARARSKRQ